MTIVEQVRYFLFLESQFSIATIFFTALVIKYIHLHIKSKCSETLMTEMTG